MRHSGTGVHDTLVLVGRLAVDLGDLLDQGIVRPAYPGISAVKETSGIDNHMIASLGGGPIRIALMRLLRKTSSGQYSQPLLELNR
jgi:hypothetical protein